ncbi:MAG: regulatory iron-sulfur-containing complex subunit RicT [Caldilineaceae bacterium]
MRDLVQKDQWEHKEAEALAICRTKAKEHKLDIKVVRCNYSFNGGRLLVYFAAESRVDFRAGTRTARIFRTRIEMRQIGVRDEAKLLDGVGKCGRQLCCTSWLREFTPVSIRMAKNQQLPLNPDEISGVCGRLLCCLSYEDTFYKQQNKKMPKLGSEVITPQGVGQVRHLHPLKEIGHGHVGRPGHDRVRRGRVADQQEQQRRRLQHMRWVHSQAPCGRRSRQCQSPGRTRGVEVLQEQRRKLVTAAQSTTPIQGSRKPKS